MRKSTTRTNRLVNDASKFLRECLRIDGLGPLSGRNSRDCSDRFNCCFELAFGRFLQEISSLESDKARNITLSDATERVDE